MTLARGPATTAWQLTGVATMAWGAALLYCGNGLWSKITNTAPDELEVLAMRALGIRHLTQGLFEVLLPGRLPRGVVAVDLLHAASMLPLALADSPRRRPVLVSATVAAASAVILGILHREGAGRAS